MPTKIKKIKCGSHANERDISEYYFAFQVTHIVDHYECKHCKDELDAQIERERKSREHNRKQEDEAYKRYQERSNKKMQERQRSIKEDIWDFVVKNELCKGIKLTGELKYAYKENIPKEILQLKRASMKLERLINGIKKGEISKVTTEKEWKKMEIERLKHPLVNCHQHGQLFIKDVVKAGKSKWTGRILYKCKICLKRMQREHYEKNKEDVLEKNKVYRVNNPEKIKQIRKAYKENKRGKDKDHVPIKRSSLISN